MKGLIGKTVALLGCTSAVAIVGGCHHYDEVVDPCYPQRYVHQAETNVNAAFAPQVRNGRVLDQTIWNYYFDVGSDKLTPGGLEHLAYIARRRPHADPVVFLQTAQDVAYDQTKPEEFPAKRNALDEKRVKAIKDYLAAQTAGGPGVTFEVVRHNPPEVGMAAEPATTSLRAMNSSARATLSGGASSPTGGGAATGGSASGGGR